MLRQQISDNIITAMKAHEPVRLGVLRYLISEIKNREIDVKHELDDTEVIEILRREVKRRKEAVEQFRAGGRTDIVEKEQDELAIIEAFLPQQMSLADVELVVDRVKKSLPEGDFGQLMSKVMQELKGKADGKLVSEAVKRKLDLTR